MQQSDHSSQRKLLGLRVMSHHTNCFETRDILRLY